MARKKAIARTRLATGKKKPVRKRKSAPWEDPLLKGAERLLATIRGMKELLREESDPAQSEHTLRLLRAARRKFAVCRRGLEIFRDHPQLGPAIRDQINLFLLIEHECRVEDQRPRPI
jgi:hypothetical protein